MNTKTKTLIAVILILLITIISFALCFRNRLIDSTIKEKNAKTQQYTGAQTKENQDDQKSKDVSIISLEGEILNIEGEKMVIKNGENEISLALAEGIVFHNTKGEILKIEDLKKGLKAAIEINTQNSQVVAVRVESKYIDLGVK